MLPVNTRRRNKPEIGFLYSLIDPIGCPRRYSAS